LRGGKGKRIGKRGKGGRREGKSRREKGTKKKNTKEICLIELHTICMIGT
jgi:hypothetical protein